jgi:hypothetical protein
MPPKTKKAQEFYALYHSGNSELLDDLYDTAADAVSNAEELLQEADDNGDNLDDCNLYVVKIIPVGRVVPEKKDVHATLDTDDKHMI